MTQADQASEAAEAILRAELVFHCSNISEVHLCLKKHLGTNDNSKLFYDSLKIRKKLSLILFVTVLKERMNHKIKSSTAFPVVQFVLSSIFQMVVFSWDLVKDLYFLAYYIHFGQISATNLTSFDSQVLFILILSIVLPNILNMIVLLTVHLASVPSKARKLLICTVYFSVSLTSYALNRINYIKARKERSEEERKLTTSKDGKAQLEFLSKLEEQERELTSLQAKLKINEGIFESSLQTIILLVTVAVSLRYLCLELYQYFIY